MKITFVRPPLKRSNFGGGNVHSLHLAKHLEALGHKIGILHVEPADCFRWFDNTKLGRWQAAQWSDVLYMRLRCTDATPGAWPRFLRLFSRMRRVPLAWEVNAPVSEGLVTSSYDIADVPRREALVRAAARSVSVAFCVSEEMCAYAHDALGLANVVYVPNGGDCKEFRPNVRPASELSQLNGLPVVFWMGSGSFPWEGDAMVVDVARKLHEEGFACKVVLAGRRREELEPLPPNVLHLGRIDHELLPSYVAAADVCLCLYDVSAYGEVGFYGSPVKLYEYMAGGRAIVATDVGETARSVSDGVDGVLVGPDINDSVRAIKMLCEEPDYRKALGRAARRKSEQFYNWRRVAQQTAEGLERVLNK